MHFENILLLVKPLPHIHLKFSNETFGSLHLWSLNREGTMCSKNSILLRLDVLEPRFQPGLEHRRSNFHHVLCTFKLSADVLRWQAMWRTLVPAKWKTEGYPLFFRLISHVLLSQAKMYFEVTQVVWVAGKYVLSFPDSTYQEYKLGLPTESSLAYDKSYHTFNMLDCLRIRVAAPFLVLCRSRCDSGKRCC